MQPDALLICDLRRVDLVGERLPFRGLIAPDGSPPPDVGSTERQIAHVDAPFAHALREHGGRHDEHIVGDAVGSIGHFNVQPGGAAHVRDEFEGLHVAVHRFRLRCGEQRPLRVICLRNDGNGAGVCAARNVVGDAEPRLEEAVLAVDDQIKFRRCVHGEAVIEALSRNGESVSVQIIVALNGHGPRTVRRVFDALRDSVGAARIERRVAEGDARPLRALRLQTDDVYVLRGDAELLVELVGGDRLLRDLLPVHDEAHDGGLPARLHGVDAEIHVKQREIMSFGKRHLDIRRPACRREQRKPAVVKRERRLRSQRDAPAVHRVDVHRRLAARVGARARVGLIGEIGAQIALVERRFRGRRKPRHRTEYRTDPAQYEQDRQQRYDKFLSDRRHITPPACMQAFCKCRGQMPKRR